MMKVWFGQAQIHVFVHLVLLLLIESSSSLHHDSNVVKPKKNAAIVFLKPHANTPAARDLIETKLSEIAPSMNILKTLSISSTEIKDKKIIDTHYYSIASKATILTSKQSGSMVNRDIFHGAFSEDYDAVLNEKRVGNVLEASKKFDLDDEKLLQLWNDAENSGKVVKLGGGFYCGQLQSKKPLYYVLNGFFISMRSKYTEPNTCVTVYEVEWDPSDLSWADFRSKFIGSTDPSKAVSGSIRNILYKKYTKFELDQRPSKSDNGVHASASPLEGMSERCNWLKRDLGQDAFGKALIKAGIKKKTLMAWCKDPRVRIEKGGNDDDACLGSLFDTVEDLDVGDCFKKLLDIHKF